MKAAMNIKDKTLLVITGPTAVGKTAIAIRLAQHFHTAILSADSRQCYKEMSIGTAKPSPEELQAVKHYFIDEFSVTEHLTAAAYERLALGYLELIFSEQDIAIMCGGTGLYIKALCEGLDEMPHTNKDIEQKTNEAYRQQGLEWLQKTIHEEDPLFYEQSEKDNPARLLRALIFKRSTGNTILHYKTGKSKQRPFNIIKIALEMPREILYTRINRRVDIMMQEGLEEEARKLYPYRHLKNLQTVGYTELFDYFEGNCTLQEAIDKIKQHTRNYAKRQITWFKKEKDIVFMNAADPDVVEKILRLCS